MWTILYHLQLCDCAGPSITLTWVRGTFGSVHCPLEYRVSVPLVDENGVTLFALWPSWFAVWMKSHMSSRQEFSSFQVWGRAGIYLISVMDRECYPFPSLFSSPAPSLPPPPSPPPLSPSLPLFLSFEALFLRPLLLSVITTAYGLLLFEQLHAIKELHRSRDSW